MHFRRAANQREVGSELEAKHVRRRIDEAETSIKIERFAGKIAVEALLQNGLEDVTSADVLFHLFHRAFELFWIEIAIHSLRFAVCGGKKWEIGRLSELAHDAVDRFYRLRINLFRWAILEEGIDDNLQSP